MEKLSAIVLAAGMGTRLGALTENTPKALVQVADRPLISYAIKFLRAVGVDNLIVVGGFHFNELQSVVKKIDADVHIVENTDYKKGTLYSLIAGLEQVDSSLLLFHGDHIFPHVLAPHIRAQLNHGVIAFTDTDRELTNDDMKVSLTSDGKLDQVSKLLTEWNCGYVGITYCDKDMLTKYRNAAREAAHEKGDSAVTEDVMRHLVAHGEDVSIGDISGYGWYEVDYPNERDRAEEAILRSNGDF